MLIISQSIFMCILQNQICCVRSLAGELTLLLQAIHTRSMVPCQDSPGVKMPYSATVSVL